MSLLSRRILPPAVWIVLGVILIWACLIFYIRSVSLFDPNMHRYIAQPVGLLLLAAGVWWLSRAKHSHLRRQREKALFLISVSLIWAIGYFLSGLAVTFVLNPLTGTLWLVVVNIIGYGLVGVILEFIRFRLILMSGRRNPVLTGSIISIVLIVFQLTTTSFNFPDALSIMQFTGTTALPLLIYHTVQTYLAYTAGFSAMLVYAIAWLIIYTFLPIMPRYDWYMAGMSALGFGTLTIVLLNHTRQDEERPLHIGKKHRRSWLADGITIVYMAALVLFMTGLFSYKPVVIMSNSMKPLYGRGDMVIVEQKNSSTKIEKDDIIQYTKDGHRITHRVVEIIKRENVVQYITKGDNSDSKDPWMVSADQIDGIVKARVPFVGYPTVVLNELLQGN